jgi:hypothetical protein
VQQAFMMKNSKAAAATMEKDKGMSIGYEI